MSISGTSLTAAIVGTISKTLALPGAGASAALVYSKAVPIDDGTGDNQADTIFYDQRTLANGASEELDLSGTLLDALGQTVNLTKVKAMYFGADPTNTDTIVIGGAAGSQFVAWVGTATDKVKIMPSGFLFVAAPVGGYAVGAGTTDKLKVLNSAAGAQAIYDVIILGNT